MRDYLSDDDAYERAANANSESGEHERNATGESQCHGNLTISWRQNDLAHIKSVSSIVRIPATMLIILGKWRRGKRQQFSKLIEYRATV